jgi:hypothetical protein
LLARHDFELNNLMNTINHSEGFADLIYAQASSEV